MRFDNCCTDEETVMKYMTDGMLLREAMTNPLLEKSADARTACVDGWDAKPTALPMRTWV